MVGGAEKHGEDGDAVPPLLAERLGVSRPKAAVRPASARGGAPARRPLLVNRLLAASSARGGAPARRPLIAGRLLASGSAPRKAATPASAPVGPIQKARARPLPLGGPPPRPVVPSSMPNASFGGVLFATNTGQRKHVESRRLADGQRAAAQRARDMHPTADAAQLARLTSGVEHLFDMSDWGAASNTLKKDDRSWDSWAEFCGVYGWDTLFSPAEASSRPDLVVSRLALFVLWVYPRIVGRGGPDSKPRSAYNYVISVIRICQRNHGVPMPRLKLIEPSVRSLLRNYKEICGVQALTARRRQPMLPKM